MSSKISEAEIQGYISYGDNSNDPFLGFSQIDKLRGVWGRDSTGKLVDDEGTVPVRRENFDGQNRNQGLPGFRGMSDKMHTHHEKIINRTEDGFRMESPYPSNRGGYEESLHMYEPFDNEPNKDKSFKTRIFGLDINTFELMLIILLVVCVVYIIILRNNLSMVKYFSKTGLRNLRPPATVTS